MVSSCRCNSKQVLDKKQLWVLAGGNGAGKSTFYQTQLATMGLPFINADRIAEELFPESAESHSYDAAKIAAYMREQLITQGESFCFETVFSHPSKIDFLAQAKANGYEIVLVFIHLDDVNLNQARVVQRVAEGGHQVPPEKIESRIPRTLENIKKSLALCDEVYILDNSSYDDPFARIAMIKKGRLSLHNAPLPEWGIQLLDDYLV